MGALFDPEHHHRRSIRLPTYDYRSTGAYFVTLCVERRLCLFGAVEQNRVTLSEAGRMVSEVWQRQPEHISGVALDLFVVMSNHLHGVVVLTSDSIALATVI